MRCTWRSVKTPCGNWINYINTFTGEFVKYEGRPPFLTKEDFNYIPRISKEQALAMHADTCKKINVETDNVEVWLHKSDNRWHWRIYASRKVKGYGRPAIMFIDSETGEVFYNTVTRSLLKNVH